MGQRYQKRAELLVECAVHRRPLTMTAAIDPLARLGSVEAAVMERIKALESRFSNLVKLLTNSSLKASEG